MNLCKIHGIAHAADTCPACDIAAELAALRAALAGLLTQLTPAPAPSLVVQEEDKTGHVASGDNDAARANHILTHKATREAVLVFRRPESLRKNHWPRVSIASIAASS